MSNNAEPLLTLKGVHTHIGQYHILQGVDLVVPRGGLSVLLGRNGAGKTTTLRTIMGLWKASAGAITFDGRAIVEPRKLLLVDEPTKGLAPAIIQSLMAAFRELKDTSTSILLVEQNFNFVRSLGDTVGVMDDGRVVHAGAMAALAGDDELQQRLLGLSLDSHQ